MDSQIISSRFYCLTAPPQYHEPSISSTISFPIYKSPFISPTSYRNPPMGPPPSISFSSNLCPSRANHITLGHLFLYLYTSPQLFVIYFTNAFISCHYITFLSSPLATCFPFLANRNPCHPWLEHYLSSTLDQHRPCLQSTPQDTYLCPLNFFTLSRLWHNLSPVLSSP